MQSIFRSLSPPLPRSRPSPSSLLHYNRNRIEFQSEIIESNSTRSILFKLEFEQWRKLGFIN